jgi:hypothetical protein
VIVLEIFSANPWLVAVAEVAVVPLIGTVWISTCVFTRKVRLARYDFELARFEVELKRDMLQRGLSAEDIRTVIEAGRQTAPKVAGRPRLNDPSVEPADARDGHQAA